MYFSTRVYLFLIVLHNFDYLYSKVNFSPHDATTNWIPVAALSSLHVDLFIDSFFDYPLCNKIDVHFYSKCTSRSVACIWKHESN